MLTDTKWADNCWWACSRKVYRASCFALFSAKHCGWPNPLCRLLLPRSCPDGLALTFFPFMWGGELVGKVCFWLKWHIPQIPGPQLLHNPQKSPNACFTPLLFLFFAFLLFFLNNLITTSCSLRPGRIQRSRCYPRISCTLEGKLQSERQGMSWRLWLVTAEVE